MANSSLNKPMNSQEMSMIASSASRVIRITPLLPDTTAGYFSVTMGLIDDAVYAPVGQGGWQIIDRPRLPAATQWFDRSPFKLELTCILDQGIMAPPPNPPADSVEDQCIQLEKWIDRAPNQYSPPALEITGPVPGTQRLWVVYMIEFQQAIRNPQSGYRVQQTIKITLYEYTPALIDALGSYGTNSPAQAALANQNVNDSFGSQQFVLYTIKQGDTFESIAAFAGQSQANTSGYVALVKNQNNIRDNAQIQYMVGQVISLPRTFMGY